MADDRSIVRTAGIAAFALAAMWAAAALATGVAVELKISEAPDLLRIIADHRMLFVVANFLGLGAQVLLVPFLVGLGRVLDRDRAAVPVGLGWWALSAVMFALSAIFHIAYGLVPAREVAENASALTVALVRDADVLHHLGDLTYFAGMLVVALALAALAPTFARDARLGRAVAATAIVTAVATVLQLGWLVGLDALNAFGILALIGQVVVLCLLGRALVRIAA